MRTRLSSAGILKMLFKLSAQALPAETITSKTGKLVATRVDDIRIKAQRLRPVLFTKALS
jgi:hypothetical protein